MRDDGPSAVLLGWLPAFTRSLTDRLGFAAGASVRNDQPVSKLTDLILVDAIRKGADVIRLVPDQVDPVDGRACFAVEYTIEQVAHVVMRPPATLYGPVLRRMAFLARDGWGRTPRKCTLEREFIPLIGYLPREPGQPDWITARLRAGTFTFEVELPSYISDIEIGPPRPA